MFNFKKKKEGKIEKKDIETLNICVYASEFIYKKCVSLFPSIYGTNDENFNFEEFNSPLGRALINYSNPNLNISNYRFCIIDEEFIEWVNNEKIINNDMIVNYVSEMSDEKAERLWNKYNMSESIEVLAIPFIVCDENIPKKTENKLSKEESDFIKDLILSNSNIREEDIYIPGYLNSFEEIDKYKEHLISLSEAYFKDKKNVVFGAMEEQNYEPEYNVFFQAIPVIFKEHINYKINNNFLDKLMEDDLLDIEFPFDEINTILLKYYKNAMLILKGLVFVEEFEDISTEFSIEITKMLKKIK